MFLSQEKFFFAKKNFTKNWFRLEKISHILFNQIFFHQKTISTKKKIHKKIRQKEKNHQKKNSAKTFFYQQTLKKNIYSKKKTF